MTERLAAAIRQHRHLRSRRVLGKDDGTPISRQGAWSRVRYATQRSNLPTGVHILRHTFCSHLAMQGAPMRGVQALVGHRSLAMTERYESGGHRRDGRRPTAGWPAGSPRVRQLLNTRAPCLLRPQPEQNDPSTACALDGEGPDVFVQEPEELVAQEQRRMPAASDQHEAFGRRARLGQKALNLCRHRELI